MGLIKQIFPGLTFSRRAMIGMTEDLDTIGESTIERTVNGMAVALQPTYGRLFSVQLRNSGDRVWLPPVEKLRVGTTWRYHCSTWWATEVRAGTTTIVLERDPVPGSVCLRDPDTDEVMQDYPFTVVGRTVTLGHMAYIHVTLAYKMALDVMVSGVSASGSKSGRDQGWQLSMEEVAP